MGPLDHVVAFVEGRTSPGSFERLLREDEGLRNALKEDVAVPPYTNGGTALHYLLSQGLSNVAGHVNAVDLLSRLLTAKGAPYRRDGAALETYELMLDAQPRWLDLPTDYLQPLLSATEGMGRRTAASSAPHQLPEPRQRLDPGERPLLWWLHPREHEGGAVTKRGLGRALVLLVAIHGLAAASYAEGPYSFERLKPVYSARRQMHFVVKNHSAQPGGFELALEIVEAGGRFRDHVSDLFARSDGVGGKIFKVGPKGTVQVGWTPNARPLNFRPVRGRKYRFCLLTLDALKGGGAAYFSTPFTFN